MYISLFPFTLISPLPNSTIPLFVYYYIFCCFYFISSYSTLKDENKLKSFVICFLLFALSYPFLYLLDRGNVEASVYVFVLLFIYFYRKKKFTISTVFLAMAISCKLFPVIFAVLYLVDKKYKEFLKVAAFSLIFTIGSFIVLKSDINMFISNLNFFTKTFFVEDLGLPFTHSLHSLFKSVIWILQQYDILSISLANSLVHYEVSIYNYIVLLPIAIITIYIIVFEKVLWRVVTLLTLEMLLFANVSFDYRMIYLMIPIMLFIISNEKLTYRYNIFYAVLFGLMIIPKNYYITDFLLNTPNIGGIINPLLFIIMIISIMNNGLKGKKFLSSIKVYLFNLLPEKLVLRK